MPNEEKRYPSRLKKKNKNRSNSVLNMMIGLVFVLILITGAFIFMDQNSQDAQQPESVRIASDTEEAEESSTEEDTTGEDAIIETNDGDDEATEEEQDSTGDASEEATEDEEGTVTVGGTITREESQDPIVEETVINTSWEPIGTSQSGNHVSVYDTSSVDWKEKIGAISYATGLGENEMYIMRIQNGGGPQKSVGIVTSKDKSEKYRVHLEWVDGEGWKPVKMDVLRTLEGAY